MNAVQVRAVRQADEAGLLILNNAHAAQTSLLDAARLHAMLGASFMAATIGAGDALLIAFDQDAAYASVNFLWFRERLQRFVYVDRIIVAAAEQGKGCGRLLYRALFERALAAGQRLVVCEVNSEPPNAASERFHAALGFQEIGTALLPDRAKRVRYLSRPLQP